MTSKLANVFREFGPGDGLLYLIHRGLSLISANSGIVNYALAAQPVPETPIISGRAYRSIELRKLEESAVELTEIPIPADIVTARFAQGAECFGIFRGEKFIGYGWLHFGDYAEDEIRVDFCRPDNSSVFDFDVYIFPDFRLGRSFIYLWESLNTVMRERNVRCSYSRISRFNTQSMRSHQQLGANIVGRIVALRLLSLQVIVSSCAPRFRLSIRPSERIRIQLPGSNRQMT